MDYENICFVIMPFGEKTVTLKQDGKDITRTVDFDYVYDYIFLPAIEAVELPEGGNLVPRRTDRDFFTGHITNEMFEYIQYARFATADISGLNANVFYELGVRHAAVESGTAIFRQSHAPLPFDIRQIKAFDYEYEPEEEAEKSRALITRVLSESLKRNRLDSPVQLTLARQRAYQRSVHDLLREAEDSIRAGNWNAAAEKYRAAADEKPQDPVIQFKLGLMHKKGGRWVEALACFDRAVALDPEYGEAHREKGIAMSQLYRRADPSLTGQAALERAIQLTPTDFDAMSSLGGILKRQDELDEALAQYEKAVEVSDGNSYPLLNALRLEAILKGELSIEGRRRFLLRRAERQLRGQVASRPPANAPWSFFDLSEIHLYQGNDDTFLHYVDEGISHGKRWEAETFRDSLAELRQARLAITGLLEGIERLDKAIPHMQE